MTSRFLDSRIFSSKQTKQNQNMASLTISSLASFFSGEQKSIDRGENHYKSEHVESFTYSTGVIRGEVHASMKNKSYKVTVSDYSEVRSVSRKFVEANSL